MKAYRAKRLVVMTESNMRMLTAEEHSVALLNLAVPSPIFSETEPIPGSASSSSCSSVKVSEREEEERFAERERAIKTCDVEQVKKERERIKEIVIRKIKDWSVKLRQRVSLLYVNCKEMVVG